MNGDGQTPPPKPAVRLAAVALPTAGTAVAFVVMSHFHLIGHEPVWVILALLLVGGLVGESTGRLLEANQSAWVLHLAVGAQCLTVGAIIYAIGWGPTLAIGFLFVAARALDLAGSRVLWAVLFWTAVATFGGELAIAFGLITSYVPVPEVHGLAALMVLGVAAVTWVLQAKTEQNEVALAARDDAVKDAQSALSLLTATLDSTADGILVVDNDGRIAQSNSRFAEMWRLPPDILDQRNDEAALAFVMEQLLYPDEFVSKVEELYANPAAESDDVLKFKDGRVFERHSLPQRIDGTVVGRVWSFRDVTDHHQLLAELEHQAFHDSLTGLANRSLLRNRLDNALIRAQRYDIPVAVLFCDLDGFKMVNDTLGHDVGDVLLVEVGRRFDECLREGDTVARFGGDEFAVILDGSNPRDAVETANRVLRALREPFHVQGREIDIRASIGVADSSTPTEDADALLCQADIAMYAAKAQGRDRVVRFEAQMQTTLAARHALHGDLRQAVRDNGELSLQFQPVFDLNGHLAVSTEALVRWNHPQRGAVPPDEFIPVAEEMGLIGEIGRFVLREACRQATLWRTLPGAAELSVAVNVSPYQLYDNRFVAEVRAALVDTGLSADGLILELTESALLSDTARVHHRLARLRDLGVRIAIDDFGTGYSSLAYLRRLPIDCLKIDRSFVNELGDPSNEQGRSLVRSIVSLGHDLGLTIVAEGIETEEELEAVQTARCDQGQGYLLAMPSTPDHVAALLESQVSDRQGRPVLTP